MARKCMGKLIFDMGRDIRMQALGPAAFGIWVMLMGLIDEIGNEGSATFGMGRAPALADVARLRFGMTETELKTQIETQSKTHLLSWNDETQTLAYAAELQPSKRTIANRLNGAKGGRPTKNRLTERTDPAQRHLPPMLIQGGKPMLSGKTQPETHAPIAKLAITESNQAIAKAPAPEAIDAVYQRIGPKAFELAGLDPVKDMSNWMAARQWAADGLAHGMTPDEIDRLVSAVVASVTERQQAKDSGWKPKHIGYFTPAVKAAIAAGDVPEAAMTPERRKAGQAFERDMLAWMRSGAQGPMPRLEDYFGKAAA